MSMSSGLGEEYDDVREYKSKRSLPDRDVILELMENLR